MAAWCSAIPGAHGQQAQSKLPPDVETAYAIAMGAPPEIAANALLRLQSRVADPALRRNLLEMTFQLAAKAQNPVRGVLLPDVEVDTRTGSKAGALRLNLDSLSLQSRVVQDMAAFDPARARELFAAIARPALPVVGCEGSVLPDVSPLYEALSAIARPNTFPPAERAKPESLTFVAAAVSRASSIAELAPAAQALANLDIPAPQFRAALDAFTPKLGNIPSDSRTFRFYAKAIDDAIGLLMARARQHHIPTEPLVDAYRAFLVAQFSAAHCADAGTRFQQISEQASLFGEAIRGDRPAIPPADMMQAPFEGELKVERYWTSPDAMRMYQETEKVRQGPEGGAGNPRRSEEWKPQIADFLNHLAGWSSSDEAGSRDCFHQKAILYERLIETLPAGELTDSVIEGFVDFLKSSDLMRQSSAEWFFRAHTVLEQLRMRRPDQAARLLAAYRGSGNMVLVLEAMLEQLPPAKS